VGECNWFDIIAGSLGGVALLMFGIRYMGDGLESAAGDAMRRILAALTRNAWMACVVGTVVTGIVQSSSAVTVMVVGFVNAQLMTFRQALGVVYGANIGTTVTGQIMAFQVTKAALPAIAIGFAMTLFGKRKVVKDIGQGILGFGILFLGLLLLKDSVATLKNSPVMVEIFQNFSHNIVMAVVAGALVTVSIQSSSASLGITMALASQNLISLEAAIGLMLGDNIGTCITAQLASIGTHATARRVALAHVLYNVFGVVLVLVLFKFFVPLVTMISPHPDALQIGTPAYQAAVQRQVANSHTLFNVLNALLFLTLNSYYAAFLERIMPDRRRPLEGAVHIDARLLDTPLAAAAAVIRELGRMARLCRGLVARSTDALLAPAEANIDDLRAQDKEIDQLQRAITNYVIDLMEREIPDSISEHVPAVLHAVNDLERVGDHCKNLLEFAEQRRYEGMVWTPAAEEDVRSMASLVDEMLALTVQAFSGEYSEDIPEHILELEKRVDRETELGRVGHMERLRNGECLPLPGVLLMDTLANYEKMGDHVRNIGRAMRDGIIKVGPELRAVLEADSTDDSEASTVEA
jgi:phosphate:Na+ symporter